MNLRNLLLNLDGDNISAFYRTIENDSVKETEKAPSEMSAFIADNHYDQEENLYVSIYPYPSGVDVLITTYER